MPEEGREKKPNTPSNPRVPPRLYQAGVAAGCEFTGACDRHPNTVKAHCLLKFALDRSGPALQHQLQDVLFRGYFHDGLYPDIDNLVVMGAEVGLDQDEVREFLASRTAEAEVRAEAEDYSMRGVNGVPFFIFNGKPMFSGAQSEQTFLRAFEDAPPLPEDCDGT